MTFVDVSREEVTGEMELSGARRDGSWREEEQTFWRTGLHNADTCMGDRRYLWNKHDLAGREE